jgi:hypothetical protein
MKKLKMIKLFESIAKYDIYSKYNIVLEKKFKDRSLKSLVDSLKSLKRCEKVPFLEEFYKKHPYDFEDKKFDDENSDISLKVKEYTEKMERESEKEKEKELMKQQKAPNNLKSEIRCSFSSKKYYDPDYPDPFKYHPNYDSIYKKVPSFKISPRKNDIKILKKKNKDIYPSLKKNKIVVLYENNSSEENKNKNNNLKNKIEFNKSNNASTNNKSNSKNLNLPLITSSNIIETLKSDNEKINNGNGRFNTIETYGFRDNHALRFSKYLPRKIKLNSTNNNISYIEPYDYALNIKKNGNIIDFKKMNSRNEKSIINVPSLDVPGIGKYSPKYNLVEDKTKNVLFSPFGENKNDKKVMLHKMLGSYKVLEEYQTINNKKLFNDRDLIRKQLIINYNMNI